MLSLVRSGRQLIRGCSTPLWRNSTQVPSSRLLVVSTANNSTLSDIHTRKRSLVDKEPEEKNSNEDKYSEQHRKSMATRYSVVLGSLIAMFGSGYILVKRNHSLQAKNVAEVQDSDGDSEDAQVSENSSALGDTLHKSQAGFRERKIIEYENRIRSYSTPDKIFRYFSTLQDAKTSDIYMSPEDFVRSITPDTMQPEGLGLDQFKKFDMKNIGQYESQNFGEKSVFHAFGDGGLISFSDYVFLLTVLGTSARHIDIAFKMFDLNGDGEVSLEEFKKVRSLFLSMTTTGSRHRDRKTTGNVLSDDSKSGLTKYFFGEAGDNKLTVDEFVNFKMKLQEEVMFLEFQSYGPKDGRITEGQFAEILLSYASISSSLHNKIMKRMKKNYADKNIGVCFKDYLQFFNFLLNIRDVEMALSFHTVAGQAINKETFKQVGRLVAGVELSDYLVDIVFCIFDENEDNHLSNREFVAIMKDKMFRGLNKPKDTGLTRFLSAIVACAKTNIMESWTQASDNKN